MSGLYYLMSMDIYTFKANVSNGRIKKLSPPTPPPLSLSAKRVILLLPKVFDKATVIQSFRLLHLELIYILV